MNVKLEIFDKDSMLGIDKDTGEVWVIAQRFEALSDNEMVRQETDCSSLPNLILRYNEKRELYKQSCKENAMKDKVIRDKGFSLGVLEGFNRTNKV